MYTSVFILFVKLFNYAIELKTTCTMINTEVTSFKRTALVFTAIMFYTL